MERIVADAGGRSAVAKTFGLSYWAVRLWEVSQVPSVHVRRLVAMANGAVGYEKWTPQDVRPDVFGEGCEDE